MGKYGEAINTLKSIRSPKPDVLAELAYTYQLDARLSDSTMVYSLAAISSPMFISLLLSAAQAEVAAGAVDQAGQFLDRAVSIDAHYYRLQAIRGEIARMREQNE